MGLRQRVRGQAIDVYLSEEAVALRRRLFSLIGASRLEFYFQVDDPYSYLLAQLLGPVVRAAGLDLDVLLVPPPATEVDAEPMLRIDHAVRDATQLAADYEVAFPMDATAPAGTFVDVANGILCAREATGPTLDLVVRVAAALWSGDEERLRGIAKDEGCWTQGSAAVLTKNAKLRRRRGHYLSGMLRYAGQWYWGVDRLRHLCAHLRHDGHAVPKVLEPRERELARSDAGELTMFFSFRSPYSYIAVMRAMAMCEKHAIALRIRPVLPMVMRGHAVPLVKRLYIARDAAREARMQDVPFGNLCDPLGPGIERCLAVFYRARELGKEVELVASIGRGAWSEARDVADEEDLRVLVERAGVPWPGARAAIEGNVWREETEANREALYALGLWGVPTFELGDFVVWGNDRLDMVERRL